MIYKLLFAFLFLLLSSTLSAQNVELVEQEVSPFTQDTAFIEQRMERMLEDDASTIGMIEASREYEKEYDKLLNKYYKLALSILNTENKERLKVSQRRWIALRDADKDLITGIVSQIRDGMEGGTIWGVIGAWERAEITKRRVIELYNFTRLSELN